MSDTKKTQEETLIEAYRLELEALDIEYHHKHGIEKLKSLLDAGVSAEAEQAKISRIILEDDPMALVRIVMYNNDTEKREYTGDYFTVISGKNKASRFVPFGNENGWHVERMLLAFLQDKKIQLWKKVKDPRTNVETAVAYQAPAFTIKVLDALTAKELDQLHKDQVRRGSIDSTDNAAVA